MRLTKAQWKTLGIVRPAPEPLATIPTEDVMNGLERQYATQVLDVREAAGEVYGYWYEAVKFRLADRTFYTPDFLVILASGVVELHETKGWWEEDARIKFKMLPELFPFPILGVRRVKKAWDYERIDPKKR